MTRRTAPARPVRAAGAEGDGLGELLSRYGCGPVKFTGADDALCERRLVFDHVSNPGDAAAAASAIAQTARASSSAWHAGLQAAEGIRRRGTTPSRPGSPPVPSPTPRPTSPR